MCKTSLVLKQSIIIQGSVERPEEPLDLPKHRHKRPSYSTKYKKMRMQNIKIELKPERKIIHAYLPISMRSFRVDLKQDRPILSRRR